MADDPGAAVSAAELAALQATIDRQQTVIGTLIETAERRLERPSLDSAYGRWEQNLFLRGEVESRTLRVREAERLMRSVIDSMDARMCIIGDAGAIVGTNRLWNRFTIAMGWTVAESGPGGNLFALLRQMPGDLDGVALAVHDVLAGRRTQSAVKAHLPLAVASEDVVVRVHVVQGHDKARAVVNMVDITEATRTQQDLSRITEQAQVMALVAKHTDNAVVIADADGRIEWVNQAFCRISGYSVTELLGLRRADIMSETFRQSEAFATFVAAIAERTGVQLEVPSTAKDGRSYWVHLEVQPIVEQGRPVRFVSVERDITQQRLADQQLNAAVRQARALTEELAAEKGLLTDVLASIPHLVYWKDADLRYAGVNQAFLDLRGLPGQDAVLERTEGELEASDELSSALAHIEPQVLATGQPVANQRLLLSVPDHPRCSLMLSVLPQTDEEGRVCGVIGVAADVTQISALEQQLAQATRLESIGQLAAGVAHEINTPVQYVSDNTRFVADTFGEVLASLRLVESLSAGDSADAARMREAMVGIDLDFLAEEIPSALQQSQEGLARVAQIVRAMKDFSHPGEGRSAADLNRAVESTVQVSRNEWRYVADVVLDLDSDVGLVPCYEGELKQVLLNIVVNAAHAISDHAKLVGETALGRIQISTLRTADGVRITVADDGPGMDESIRTKIFDPFFTTKPVGKGTGQGLSMAYAIIVQKHGGTLSVDSAPGAGSTFTIDLPDDPAGSPPG